VSVLPFCEGSHTWPVEAKLVSLVPRLPLNWLEDSFVRAGAITGLCRDPQGCETPLWDIPSC